MLGGRRPFRGVIPAAAIAATTAMAPIGKWTRLPRLIQLRISLHPSTHFRRLLAMSCRSRCGTGRFAPSVNQSIFHYTLVREASLLIVVLDETRATLQRPRRPTGGVVVFATATSSPPPAVFHDRSSVTVQVKLYPSNTKREPQDSNDGMDDTISEKSLLQST
jgi:hypothetical protein